VGSANKIISNRRSSSNDSFKTIGRVFYTERSNELKTRIRCYVA